MTVYTEGHEKNFNPGLIVCKIQKSQHYLIWVFLLWCGDWTGSAFQVPSTPDILGLCDFSWFDFHSQKLNKQVLVAQFFPPKLRQQNFVLEMADFPS